MRSSMRTRRSCPSCGGDQAIRQVSVAEDDDTPGNAAMVITFWAAAQAGLRRINLLACCISLVRFMFESLADKERAQQSGNPDS